ncbi:MFS transporter [Promethearchaeum syntrophicum]|uniref:MFS transporter n=1 Tax=Promethearchaeum syntrophicum TaxID=2594042 RepID=A0A5B9D7C2_9ARCH|nr:MFS transporter [Candidatus Prometheoarchaeum syntrophicum]
MAVLQSVVGGGALTYYFTKIRGLDGTLSGIVWLLFGIWNAVNDPLYGYISDKTKNKLGRRKPYIRFGAPLLAISYILCWLIIPDTDTQPGLFIQLLVCLFFYDTLYTAVASALYVMPFEMAVSNKARSPIFVWKIAFSVLSIAFPAVVIPMVKPDVGDDLTSYQIFHVILGVIVGIVTFVSTFFYKENQYLQEEEQMPFFKGIKATFRNKPFIIFLIISFTVIYVQTSLFQGLNYYPDEIETINMMILLVGLALSTIVTLIIFILKHEAWGVKKCMQIALIAFAIGCFSMVFGGRTQVFAMISFVGCGVGVAAGFYMLTMQFGDVMDYDELQTGLRREGIYAGVNSLVTKPAISLANAAFIWIIEAFGYNQTLQGGLQDNRAETGIILAWMLIPAILLTICFIVMFRYPLAGDKWKTDKNKLTVIHQQKEKDHLEKLGFKYEP